MVSGWSVCDLPRRKNTLTLAVFTGPPVAWISLASMFDSASSAASIAAAFAFHAIGSVVWPLKVSVNVPPVALVTRTVCCSSVSWSLNGP